MRTVNVARRCLWSEEGSTQRFAFTILALAASGYLAKGHVELDAHTTAQQLQAYHLLEPLQTCLVNLPWAQTSGVCLPVMLIYHAMTPYHSNLHSCTDAL